MRSRHYSRRTEEAYAGWIKRFIFFHNKRHPSSMGGEEVNAFLSWLATEQNVSASTQNQALGALLFLYRHVLDDPLPWLKDVVRATRPSRLPVVTTPEEVRRPAAGGEEYSGRSRSRQTGNLPHLPSLLRHPPAGARRRHPHRSGAPRPPRRDHDHDLYPRPAVRSTRRAESSRHDLVLAIHRPCNFSRGVGTVRATRHAPAMQLPALSAVPALAHRARHHFRHIARHVFHRGESNPARRSLLRRPGEVQVRPTMPRCRGCAVPRPKHVAVT